METRNETIYFKLVGGGNRVLLFYIHIFLFFFSDNNSNVNGFLNKINKITLFKNRSNK